jgi:chromate transporter
MLHRLIELAGCFLKLGAISFGGPAAHLAMMDDEVVVRRGWLSREQFLDLVAATNLIPGPNAVQMASHVGHLRAGLLGTLVAGCAFTLPATLIAIGFAWGYERYGTLPEVEAPLAGIRAAVLAVIFAAVVRLSKASLRKWPLAVVAAGVVAASQAGADEIPTLLTGSLAGVLLLWLGDGYPRRGGGGAAALLPAAMFAPSLGAAAGTVATAATTVASVPLWKLFLFFLKVGVVFFGGGYVLVAYIQGGLVERYGFSPQLLNDTVAVGSITPGPMLAMVTFVGYLVGGGVPGALVATAGILLPSFFLVVAINPLIPRLRRSRLAGRFLDAVVAAAIGLMASVTLDLVRVTLVASREPPWLNWQALFVTAAAAGLALRWKIAPAWLVLGGALAGVLMHWSHIDVLLR